MDTKVVKDDGVKPNEQATKTSLTLLERIKNQDQAAWEKLVNLYTPLVCYWCRSWGLQPSDVADICQDVFQAVARTVATFRHDRQGDSFRAWLRTITQNKLRDRRIPLGGQGDGGSDAQGRLQQLASAELSDEQQQADAVEKNILYRRAVELIEVCFELKTQRAFWLRMAGKSAAEVAAELHMSETAVHIAKSRVLKRLKEEFRGLLEPDTQEARKNYGSDPGLPR